MNAVLVGDSSLTRFLAALNELPKVVAQLVAVEEAGGREQGFDARVEAQIAGQSVVLLVESKSAIFPRDVRELVWRLRATKLEALVEHASTTQPILIAESISPGAKDLLRNEQVGYYDSGGSLYLPAPGAYIYIDKPAPKALQKSIGALFAGRRAQVLHTLLIKHEQWVGVSELAQQAMVSAATASQVMGELERFDWIEVRGQGPGKERLLREPAALLDAWTKQLAAMRPAPIRRYHVPWTKADALAEQLGMVLDEHHVEYALSHEVAAQHYAPFLTNLSQVRARVLISAGLDSALEHLQARVVHEGANLAVIEASSMGDLLFRERVDDLWLASPIHVYLDLLGGEGRAKDMAAHFRRERIGF